MRRRGSATVESEERGEDVTMAMQTAKFTAARTGRGPGSVRGCWSAELNSCPGQLFGALAQYAAMSPSIRFIVLDKPWVERLASPHRPFRQPPRTEGWPLSSEELRAQNSIPTIVR